MPADAPEEPRPDDRTPPNRPAIRRHTRRTTARDTLDPRDARDARDDREVRHVSVAREAMPGAERRARQRPARRSDLASPASQAAYRRMMEALKGADVAFLVGGAYAFTPFTGIPRSTKDFDVFVAKSDIGRALRVLEAAGFRTELTFPHWLAKAYWGNDFIDLIFGSGNGVAPVDAHWFDHAPTGTVLGLEVRLAPAEEMLWSKAFVMERERYDGGDVIHLLRARADKLDWQRVLDRFGEHWRVLLSNLILFGFVYPGERTRVPAWVMETLVERLRAELTADAPVGRLCNGTMLSRQQYLPDVLEWGYADGRLAPLGGMSAEEIADWTAAIGVRR